jgi:hypothetical protein
MDISTLIWPSVNRPELARVLDDVADDVRLKSLYELGRREMARLFEAALDNDPLTLDHFVPPGTPNCAEVIHDGKNSLALFRQFRKKFCRPGAEQELWGYNDQPLHAVTGPGYFVAVEDKKEVIFNYGRLPQGRVPEGWPPVTPNDQGFSRFIYGESEDIVRRVSSLVSIGRVYRHKRPRDVWFMLVRETGRSSSTLPYPRP